MKILDLLHIVIKLYIIKDNNDTKLEETIKCYLATNLPIANYNDELIKKIYCMRWDVEVFFKLVKSNFNFAYLREHNSNTLEQYKKKYLIIVIKQDFGKKIYL